MRYTSLIKHSVLNVNLNFSLDCRRLRRFRWQLIMSSVLSIGNQEECHVLICLKDPKTTRHSGFSRWERGMYRRVGQAAKRPESIFGSRAWGTARVRCIFIKWEMAFIAAGRIWIPVFFALYSTVLRCWPKTAKKPEWRCLRLFIMKRRILWYGRISCVSFWLRYCILIAPKAPLLPGEILEEA